MKYKGRSKSKNMVDKRNYFGSMSDSGMTWLHKVKAFRMESFKAARDYSGVKSYNKFKK